MTKKLENLMNFNCTFCGLIDLFCSKWLIFETTNLSKYVDFQDQGEV